MAQKSHYGCHNSQSKTSMVLLGSRRAKSVNRKYTHMCDVVAMLGAQKGYPRPKNGENVPFIIYIYTAISRRRWWTRNECLVLPRSVGDKKKRPEQHIQVYLTLCVPTHQKTMFCAVDSARFFDHVNTSFCKKSCPRPEVIGAVVINVTPAAEELHPSHCADTY